MEFTDEEINSILDSNFITYDYFELTQMMLIKDMMKRVLVDYYGIGYKDGLEVDRELEEFKSILNNYIRETR